jgi:PAS domain S-box-containing protein
MYSEAEKSQDVDKHPKATYGYSSYEVLKKAFPFHFLLRVQDGIIVGAGPSLLKLLDQQQIHLKFTDIFSIEAPSGVSINQIHSYQDQLFVLKSKYSRDFKLRGQLLQFDSDLLFIGSPWLSQAGTMQELGLSLEDFAVHDPAIDLLLTLQIQETTLKEVRQLAASLNAQKSELRSVNKKLSILHDLSDILSSHSSLEDIATSIIEIFADAYYYEAGALWLVDKQYRKLSVVGVWSQDGPEIIDFMNTTQNISFIAGEGIPGSVWQQGKFREILDLSAEREIIRLPLAQAAGIKSCFALPILGGGKILGVIELYTVRPDDKADSTLVQIARETGEKIGTFVEQKTSRADLQRKDFLLRGIAEATSYLLTSSDFSFAIQEAIITLGVITGVDRVSVYQCIDQEKDSVLMAERKFTWTKPVAEAGEIPDIFKSTIPFTAMPADWSDAVRQGRVISGEINDFSWQEAVYLSGFGINSLLLVPVMIENEAWGFITFDSFLAGQGWNINEESLLMAMSGTLGGAIARRRAMEELNASREQYRAIFNSIKEVIFQTDNLGHWTLLNPAWTEITGFSLDETLGRDFLNYVHPDDRERNYELFKPLIERKKEYCRHIVRYLTKDGSFRWMEVFARLMEDEHGAIAGTAGTLNDVTERIRAEHETALALQHERELNELKSRFITTMSHEFRTPLTAILSAAELLEQMGEMLTPDEHAEHFRQIQDSVSRMTSLLDDILFVGRSNEGSVRFQPESIELNNFFADVLREIRLADGGEHIILSNIQADSEFIADIKLLRQICINLLSNAVKYSPAGTAVFMDVELNEHSFILRVEDSGIGIPEEDQKHLFKNFQRASNVGTVQGTGLGLTIVKKAVDMHGGSIEFTSEPDAGTIFTVKLPCRTY